MIAMPAEAMVIPSCQLPVKMPTAAPPTIRTAPRMNFPTLPMVGHLPQRIDLRALRDGAECTDPYAVGATHAEYMMCIQAHHHGHLAHLLIGFWGDEDVARSEE